MPRAPPFKEQIDAWDSDMENDPQVSPKTRKTYIPATWRIYKYGVAHGWPMNAKKLEPKHYTEYYRSLQGLVSKTQSTYMAAFTAFLIYVKNPTRKNAR